MKSETPFTITASDLDSPMRLDAYAALALEGISRSQFTQNAAGIRLDGKPAKPSAAVKNGQVISFVLHRDSFEGVIPQPMDLEVLYEDDDVLVINKPRGLVV
ncbi:MAG: RluA family pseudouridine synthase, partial [Sphaerochaetaceae bacterium]